MYPETLDAALKRLDFDYKFKTSFDKEWLREGICPSCNKKELYTSAKAPWRITCGRLNHCGYSAELRDLYPEIFANWAKRYPNTTENKNAAADAYLTEGRGLNINKLKGYYSQESYWNPEKKHGSVTVRFPVADGWWERLIDITSSDMPKGRMKPGWSPKGHWWIPPEIDIATKKEIWICEGIFDCIALAQNGIATVTPLTCNNYPIKALNDLAKLCESRKLPRPRLIWAFDTGNAGEDFTERFALRARQDGWECSAAQPPKGDMKIDWNTLHQSSKLTQFHIEDYRYNGDLLLAETPQDKALMIYNRKSTTNFPFEHGNRMYWCKIDLDKYHKARETQEPLPDDLSEEDRKIADKAQRDDALIASNSVVEIANCHPEPLYYQCNPVTDESWYYFRINFPKGKPIKNTFTGGQLSAGSEFKKRMLSIAPGVIYTGSSSQLDRFLKGKIEGIKRVETIDYIGYCMERSTYIYNYIAFHNGKTYALNQEDFFELPKNLNIKSLASSPEIIINTKAPEEPINWLNDLITAWGEKGVISLTAFFGSLFAQQIRAKHKSFPFTEIVGDPGAGKSTLILFLWALIGRDGYEGIDPSKSTRAGRLRTLSQVSNMPVVFIEADRDNGAGKSSSQFEWDEFKNLYDGGAAGTRGMKNGGNETYEPLFKGSLIMSQNLSILASQAFMSRICHMHFTTAQQTRESEGAARRLEALHAKDVSKFLFDAIKQEAPILETYFSLKTTFENKLKDSGVKSFRVAHCHAQFAALFEALKAHVLPELKTISDRVHAEIVSMAHARDKLLEHENQMVIQFWETVERIESQQTSVVKKDSILNHAKGKDQSFAINFAQLYQVCKEKYYDLPPIGDLQDALRTSKRYKFRQANHPIQSAIEKRTMRCWIFDQPTGASMAED